MLRDNKNHFRYSFGNKMTTISERLDQALRTRRMSPAQLAKKSKVSEGAISNILAERRVSPRRETITKLAVPLGVPVAWLFGETDDPTIRDEPGLSPYVQELAAIFSEASDDAIREVIAVARVIIEADKDRNEDSRYNALLLGMVEATGSEEVMDDLLGAVTSPSSAAVRRDLVAAVLAKHFSDSFGNETSN